MSFSPHLQSKVALGFDWLIASFHASIKAANEQKPVIYFGYTNACYQFLQASTHALNGICGHMPSILAIECCFIEWFENWADGMNLTRLICKFGSRFQVEKHESKMLVWCKPSHILPTENEIRKVMVMVFIDLKVPICTHLCQQVPTHHLLYLQRIRFNVQSV